MTATPRMTSKSTASNCTASNRGRPRGPRGALMFHVKHLWTRLWALWTDLTDLWTALWTGLRTGRGHPPPGLARRPLRRRGVTLAAAFLFVAASGCATAATPIGWAGPVATDKGLVVVQDKPGHLVAMDPKSGAEVWRFPASLKGAGDPAKVLGEKLKSPLYATPVGGGGALYIISYLGNVTRLNLDGDTLTVPWQVDLANAPSRLSIRIPFLSAPTPITAVATPQLRGDRLHVFAEDGRVFVLDTKDGRTLSSSRPTEGRVWGAPARRAGTIYIGGLDSSDLVALNAETGATEWTQRLSAATAADVVVDGDTLIVASFDRALRGLDATARGAERWRFDGDGWFVGAPLVTRDAIYAASMRGTVYALDKGGKQRWQRSIPDAGRDTREFRSSPVLVGDTLVVVSRDGTAYGLAAADGAERWSKAAGGKVEADGLLLESGLFYTTTARALVRIDPSSGAIQSFDTQPSGGK